MTRIYSDFTSAETKHLLDRIANRATSSDDYKQAMLSLGRNLGDVLLPKSIRSGREFIWLRRWKMPIFSPKESWNG